MIRKWKILLFFTVLLMSVCKDPYYPEIKPEQTNFLVVEGFINARGPTNITLSRTTGLKDSSAIQTVQGAAITIVGEDNTTIQLFENTGGHYQSDSVTFYLSVKQTPAY